jgi:hypothetical protein
VMYELPNLYLDMPPVDLATVETLHQK